MKWLIILAGLMVFSGCATVKSAAVNKAAKLSTSALLDAEWWICKGSPIGSVQLKYGVTTERANMYKQFCFGQGSANIVGPR